MLMYGNLQKMACVFSYVLHPCIRIKYLFRAVHVKNARIAVVFLFPYLACSLYQHKLGDEGLALAQVVILGEIEERRLPAHHTCHAVLWLSNYMATCTMSLLGTVS
jgi:hypothetical protein